MGAARKESTATAGAAATSGEGRKREVPTGMSSDSWGVNSDKNYM